MTLEPQECQVLQVPEEDPVQQVHLVHEVLTGNQANQVQLVIPEVLVS